MPADVVDVLYLQYCACRSNTMSRIKAMLHRINVPAKNLKRERTIYSIVRPIALLAKLLGTFPLIGASRSNGNNLRYRIWSLSTLWGAAFFSGAMTLLLYQGTFIYDYSQQSDAHFWQVLMLYLLVVRSVVQFVLCQLTARFIPPLLRGLEKSKCCCKANPQRQWTYLPFLIFTLELVAILTIDTIYYQTFFPPEAQLYIVSSLISTLRIWQILPSILFLCFCALIRKTFNTVTKETRDVLMDLKHLYAGRKKDNEKTEEELNKAGETLEYLRLEHELIQQCVHDLSKCYGVHFAVDYISMILMMCVALYFSIRYRVDLFFILSTINNFITGLSAPFASHAIRVAAEGPLRHLSLVPGLHVRDDIRHQIDKYHNQIVLTPVEITAGGFFEIDRKRLVSMVGTVATYLIVLLEYGNMIADIANTNDNEANLTTTQIPTTLF